MKLKGFDNTKVKDLINYLQQCNPDLDVYAGEELDRSDAYPVFCVDEIAYSSESCTKNAVYIITEN